MSEDINYRKMKQKYLREQIIAENFDAEDFSEYLASKKEDGKLTRNQYRCMGVRRADISGGEL